MVGCVECDEEATTSKSSHSKLAASTRIWQPASGRARQREETHTRRERERGV